MFGRSETLIADHNHEWDRKLVEYLSAMIERRTIEPGSDLISALVTEQVRSTSIFSVPLTECSAYSHDTPIDQTWIYWEARSTPTSASNAGHSNGNQPDLLCKYSPELDVFPHG